MAEQVNIHYAKTHLSRLLEQVEAGEEIVIARNGRPIARLSAVEQLAEPRKPGRWKGQIWMSDDFNDPLPAEIIDAFYNSPIFPE